MATETGLPPDRLVPIQGHLNSAERWRMIWGFAKGTMIALTLFLVIIQTTQTNSVVSAIREGQKSRSVTIEQTARAAKAAQEGVDILRDCLDPKGECGSRNAANQGRILDIVKGFIIDTARCQLLVTQAHDPAALDQCVDRLQKGRAQ